MRLLRLFNRQKTRALRLPLLRQAGRHLLEEARHCSQYELALHFVAAPEMAQLNENFLGHSGSTDVITFDYRDPAEAAVLRGEIFICVDDALAQAPRFGTTWQSEIVRYLVHGVLHLEGYDDTTPGRRKLMKREENKLVKELSRRFDLGRLGRG